VVLDGAKGLRKAVQRWVATALLDIEPGLRRIRGYSQLPALRRALQMKLNLISNYEEKLA
jgi:hypothetical protein